MAAQLEGQTLHTVLVAKNGDVWMGLETPGAVMCLRDGQLRKIDLPTDSRVIRAMTEDAAGTIWLGTSKGILFRIHGDQLIQENPRQSQELSPIRCLYATPDGTVWIGYAGSGVGCLKDGH